MPWFKVDDGFHSHEKTIEAAEATAGREAMGLWAVAGSWSADVLTDGRVPLAVVKRLGWAKRHAEKLVTLGLWEHHEGGGYQFHDWAEYQPTRAEVLEEREAKAKAGRAGGLASGRSRREARASSKPVAGASQSVEPPSRPYPTRPYPERESPPLPPSPSLTSWEDSDSEDPEDPPTLYAYLLLGYQRRRQDAGLMTESTGAKFGELMTDVKDWVEANAPRPLAYSDSFALSDAFDLADRLLDGFFASPKARAAGYRITWLAHPAEFLADAPKPEKPEVKRWRQAVAAADTAKADGVSGPELDALLAKCVETRAEVRNAG